MAYINAHIYAPTPDAPTLRTPTFRDGDIVVITAGTLQGITGKVVDTDSLPGTASVRYVPSWNPKGCTAYSIPEAHLLRLPS